MKRLSVALLLTAILTAVGRHVYLQYTLPKAVPAMVTRISPYDRTDSSLVLPIVYDWQGRRLSGTERIDSTYYQEELVLSLGDTIGWEVKLPWRKSKFLQRNN